MALKTIRSHHNPISIAATLATADDLDGTTDNTQAFYITGVSRGIVIQHNNGTLGTAGIDVIEYSHDGGNTYAAATDLILNSGNDFTGTVAVAGVLNAAGVEPVNVAIWTCGPFESPTVVRCARKTTTTTGTTWITGAPTVQFMAIGGSHAGGALTAVA
jgi:hypothetical protein